MKPISARPGIPWYYLVAPFGLVLITVLCYLPSLHYAFQFDDVANIVKYFDIRHNTFWKLFFTGSRWISYWLNAIHYSIGKFDPFSYRVGNVIIHNLNGLLVFYLFYTCLSRLKKPSFFKDNNFIIALISSALFLLHPVQTQTVCYVIQGELEGMAALFSLSTIACFLQVTIAHSVTSYHTALLLMFTLTAFACGTKEITIVLPLLILLVDWFFVAHGSWQTLKKRWWLHAMVFGIIGYLYMRLLTPRFFYDLFGLKMAVKNNIGNIITHHPQALITPFTFFLSQFKVILHYIGIFLWPFNISVEYDWLVTKGFFAPDCYIPLILLLTIAGYTVRLLKHNKISPLGFGIIWFFICIIPRSSIIPSPELIVDYKTYLGSIGWLFIIASTLAYCFVRVCAYVRVKTLYTHAALTLLVALGLGYQTQERNKVWSSGLAFWGNIIENAPGKARAHNNYGVELSQNLGKYRESIPHFQRAISMDAQYPDPCNNLAVAYARTNNLDGAIAMMKQCLTINKQYPEGHNNLASFFLEKGDADNAQVCLKKALSYRPHYGKAHFNLGRVHALRGNQELAWQCYKKACMEADFDTEPGFCVYAQASLALKKYDDAIIGFKKVLELNPSHVSAMFHLANAFHITESYHDALTWYQKTLAHTPTDERVLFNIGETYLKLGNIAQALKHYQRIPNGRMPHTAQRLVECHRLLGQEDKAIQLASRAQKSAAA